MKLKEIKEQVMSGAVGANPLHHKNVLRHGSLLPMVRRPMTNNGLIPFEKMAKKKRKKKDET